MLTSSLETFGLTGIPPMDQPVITMRASRRINGSETRRGGAESEVAPADPREASLQKLGYVAKQRNQCIEVAL
jgi:hypothetical protein